MTLDETYERILLGIDREKRDHAIRLLKCLAFSRRPLRVKELAEILAVQFDTTIPRLDTSLRPGDADEAVLSACSTLVTTIKFGDYDHGGDFDYYDYFNYHNSRLVQFSHYSVKEFLTSERLANSDKRDLSQYYISPEPAHTILAQSCISTLLQLDHTGKITDKFPLSRYAARNWFHHAQYDGVASRIQDGMERLFDPDRKHFAIWISIHDIDNSRFLTTITEASPKASPLYYAALCGIRSLVEHFVVTRQLDPKESHGRQGTPFVAAVVSGHTTIVRFLLEHTTDVNAGDMDAAVRFGNLDIAQLLLTHGANVNTLDNNGGSSVHNEAQSQKPDVMEFLLMGHADMNDQSSSNPTLLHVAARSGNHDVTQWLLRHGADVNETDFKGRSPLHKAVRSQNYDAVELLLKAGADVNIRDIDNPSPLHEAADSGNLDVVLLLLRHGADVNELDSKGRSPLHKAVRSQNYDAVKLLLKGGADVNVWQIMGNPSPLHEATDSGNLDIAQLIPSHGANVNVLDYLRGSLLGHEANVKVWVFRHKTPLHLASLGGSFDISRLLIEHGADINAQDGEGQTPFSIALANGHRKLARFLSNDRVPEHDV